LKRLDSRFHGNDRKTNLRTFYEIINNGRLEQWNDGKNKNSGMMEDWNNGWWKRDSVISNPNIPFFHDSNIPKKGRAWL